MSRLIGYPSTHPLAHFWKLFRTHSHKNRHTRPRVRTYRCLHTNSLLINVLLILECSRYNFVNLHHWTQLGGPILYVVVQWFGVDPTFKLLVYRLHPAYKLCIFSSVNGDMIWVYVICHLLRQLSAAMMSWVGCLLKDSDIFILFAINSQIFLKISVILLTFMFQVALLVNNQLNSLLRQIIDSHQSPIQIPNTKLLFFGCSSY